LRRYLSASIASAARGRESRPGLERRPASELLMRPTAIPRRIDVCRSIKSLISLIGPNLSFRAIVYFQRFNPCFVSLFSHFLPGADLLTGPFKSDLLRNSEKENHHFLVDGCERAG
jgi:hypothetical protein